MSVKTNVKTEVGSPKTRRIYYGWVIVGVAIATGFAGATLMTEVLGVFMNPLTKEFGWSKTLVSGAVSMAMVTLALVSPFIGRYVDRYGPRLIVPLGAIGGTIALVGLARISTPLGLYVFLVLGRVVGLGVGQLSMQTTVVKWFSKARGRALAFSQTGTSLGQMVLPVLAALVMSIYSWRAAMYVFAATVLLLVVIPGLLFLKKRPEDIGLAPDGLPASGADKGQAGSSVTSRDGQSASQEVSWSLKEAKGSLTFWNIILVSSLYSVVVMGITLHQVAYFISRGIDATTAAATVTAFAVATGSGRLLWGFLVDKLPLRALVVGALLLVSVGLGMLIAASAGAPALAFVAIAVLGFGSSGEGMGLQIMLANYYGREHYGELRGFMNLVHGVVRATGPIGLGIYADVTGDYRGAFMGFIGLVLLCALLVSQARPPKALARAHGEAEQKLGT